MNRPAAGPTARIVDALATGARSVEQLMDLGLSRNKVHKVLHRLGGQVLRVDTNPNCGRTARPVYSRRR